MAVLNGNLKIGDKYYVKASVPQRVNQLVPLDKIHSTTTTHGLTFTKNSNGTLTVAGTADANSQFRLSVNVPISAGHKYLIKIRNETGSSTTFNFDFWKNNGSSFILQTNEPCVLYQFASTDTNIGFYFNYKNGQTYNLVLTPNLTDLTDIFGAGNEPTSINDSFIVWLKSYLAEHPEYNEGSTVQRTIYDNPSTLSNGTTKSVAVPTGKLTHANVNVVGGKSSKVNQLVQNGNFVSASGWAKESGVTFSASNNIATIVTTNANNGIYQTATSINQHKYLMMALAKGETGLRFNLTSLGGTAIILPTNASNFTLCSYIYQSSRDNTAQWYLTLPETNKTVYVKNLMFVDLTAIYGSGNEPSTVAQFLLDHPEYNNYVDYTTGTVIHADVEDIESVGVNLWDEEWENGWIDNNGRVRTNSSYYCTKNFIKVTPNTTYYFLNAQDGATNNIRVAYYDSAYNYIGNSDANNSGNIADNGTRLTQANCHYIKIWREGATYNNDIQIALNTNPDKTTYHPYFHDTLTIPQAIRNLEGYGQAYDTSVNTLNLANKTFTAYGKYVGTTWTPFATPQVTDISALLPSNIISTQSNGTLTFNNANNLDVPSIVKYWNKYDG